MNTPRLCAIACTVVALFQGAPDVSAQYFHSTKVKNFAIVYVPLSGTAYRSLDMGYTWTPVQYTDYLATSVDKSTPDSFDQSVQLRIFPNPVIEEYAETEVTAQMPINNSRIVAVNLLGEEVQLWQGSLQPGSTRLHLNVSQLAKGQYFLRLMHGTLQISTSFIRQ